MIIAKCRCVSCKLLVEKWIDDKCVACYYQVLTGPLELELNALRSENLSFRTENLNLREVFIESSQAWSSIVESYRSRVTVKVTDWFFNTVGSIIGFIRLFSIGGGAGFRNLLSWPKK